MSSVPHSMAFCTSQALAEGGKRLRRCKGLAHCLCKDMDNLSLQLIPSHRQCFMGSKRFLIHLYHGYGYLQTVALKSDGYDAADMRAFIDRAIHAAVRRNIFLQESLHPGTVLIRSVLFVTVMWQNHANATIESSNQP